MSIKLLRDLPDPPEGRTGWPWTEESKSLSELQHDGTPWAPVSIITPSYNQGQYIEEAIRSVLLQNYPNLEYIIMDGGSTDETLNILKKYSEWINFWISEPDKGQSNAINKGFKKCTGKYVTWTCSDDKLCCNALTNIAPLILSDKDIFLSGNGYRIDKNSKIIDTIRASEIININQLVDLKNFWRKGNSILQQATFFPVSAVKKAGYLNESNHYTMDFELWGRMLLNGIEVTRTDVPIGMFRWYAGQKTSHQAIVTKIL